MLVAIYIDKETTYDRVGEITANLGVKSADDRGNVRYQQLATNKHNHELLDGYWTDALDQALDAIQRFVAHVENSATGISVDLSVPSNIHLELLESAQQSVRSFFVYYITARWLEMVDPTEAPLYHDMANQNLSDFRSKIHARRAPIRQDPKA